MAMVKFEKKAPVVVAKKSVVVKTSSDEKPVAAMEDNGSGVILIFFSRAVDEFNLKPGDRINLHWDKQASSIGVEFDKNGAFPLCTHGTTDRRLKVAITKLYRACIEETGMKLPFRGPVRINKKGLIVFRLLRRKERTVVAKKEVKATVKKSVVVAPPAVKRGRPKGSVNKGVRA